MSSNKDVIFGVVDAVWTWEQTTQMFRRRQFGDEQLEGSFRVGQRRQRILRLIAALYALILAFLFVALNHLFRPDVALVWATISGGIALGLIIRLNILASTLKYKNLTGDESTAVFTVSIVWLWLVVVSICVLATVSALAFLPTIIGVFAFYTALPVGLSGAIIGGTSLSLVHLTAFILSAAIVETHDGVGVLQNPNGRAIVEQLVALLIAHLWINFVGIYLFTARNRLCRVAFLNARNALACQRDATAQFVRMGSLLRASLSPHVIADVRHQLGADVPRVYVEHFLQTSVILCRLYGLQTVLDQLSVQDSARLLNEFHYRIDQLVERYNFVRMRSDAIVVVAGILPTEENGETQRPLQSYYFAKDLVAIFRSFCSATTANIQLRIGIGSGALSCGIVGIRKWHYDAVGDAFDSAQRLESLPPTDIISILIDDQTNTSVSQQFITERTSEPNAWRIVSYRTLPTAETDGGAFDSPYCMRSGVLPSLLFSSAQKRFSLVTVSQAISCLLQSSAVASAASSAARITVAAGVTAPLSAALAIPCAVAMDIADTPQPYSVGRRKKRKSVDFHKSSPKSSSDAKTLLSNSDTTMDERRESAATAAAASLLHPVTQRFADLTLERQYAGQLDRWLIPALAISIFFLVVNAFYQMLVLPRLLSTLLIGAGGLFILLAVMLLLYVKYCESFCQFVTRTTVGYSITVLLILVVLFLCGIVNAFSCEIPRNSLSTVVVIVVGGEGACSEVHYAAGSVALWMLTAALFIRFGFFRMLCVMGAALAAYGIHVFSSHFDFYARYSQRIGWRVDYDIAVALVTLAVIVLLHARHNERLLRLDFLSVIRTVSETRRLEHIELLNDQLIFNSLPAHIAHHYLTRSDTYQHLCQSVGVLSARIGALTDWQGEHGFDRLNRVIFALDKTLAEFAGIEKVHSAHCVYVCAVGIQPESANAAANINDAPRTIGDLLFTLAEFALQIQNIAASEGLECCIGMDCGPALSLVLGQNKPQYELIGVPCELAACLMRHASGNMRIVVSEEIHLALRPRVSSDSAAFEFDSDEPHELETGLLGYVLMPKQQCARQKSRDRSHDEVHKITSEIKCSPQSEALTPIRNSKQSNRVKNDHAILLSSSPYRNDKNGATRPITTKLRQSADAHVVRQHVLTATATNIGTPTLTAAVKEMRRTTANDSCTTASFSSLSLGETDFDEVDERMAAAACAEGRQTVGVQAIPMVESTEIHTLELPSDLRALTKDKRMSGYFDDCVGQHRRGEARHLAEHNSFEMFTSLNSSFSSELYSVDMSVESDSEIEWITPEMAAYGNDSGRYFAKHDHINSNKRPFSASKGRDALLAHLSAHSSRRALNDSGDESTAWHAMRARRQHSDQMSDRGWEAFSSRLRRKRFHASRNNSRLPVWLKSASRTSLSSQFTNATSRSRRASYSALDRLDVAARRVDKMLQELVGIDDCGYSDLGASAAECARFPIYAGTSSMNASVNALVIYDDTSTRRFGAASRRELSSACHTDYDNAEEEDGICSDPGLDEIYGADVTVNLHEHHEVISATRKDGAITLAQKLKRALLGLSVESVGAGALPPFPPVTSIPRARPPTAKCMARSVAAGAYEADVDSNCSSIASSLMFLNAAGKSPGIRPSAKPERPAFALLRRNSVHSVGYDNEYELVSESDYGLDSDLNVSHGTTTAHVDGAFDPTCSAAAPKFPAIDDADDSGAGEVRALSRDIRRAFGDYQLAGFSDV